MNKLIVNAASLQAAVKVIAPVCATNTVIPILECVKFSTVGSTLYLEASDIETTIKTSLSCTSLSDFSFCFPFNKLKGIVGEVGAGTIEIEHIVTRTDKGNSYSLKVKSAYGKSEMLTHDPTTFANPLVGDVKARIEFDREQFTKIRTATNFAHTDNKNARMNVVCFDFHNKLANVAATNGNILFVSESISAESEKNCEVLLSLKVARTVSIILEAAKVEVVEYEQRLNHMRFICEETEITCKLVDQNFPRYRNILPNYDSHFMVDKAAFTSAIRYALLSASQTTNVCHFELSDKLTISASDTYSDTKCTCEPIAVVNQGVPAFEWYMQGKDLMTCLNTVGEEVIMRTSGVPQNSFIIEDCESKDFALCGTISFN